MYVEEVYHGTSRDRGLKMIKDSIMEESKGDRHWLGDGSYFYKDDFYAFKWIKDMSNSKDLNYLFEKYIIITGELRIKKERVFDLENPRHKIIFDKVETACKVKKDYSTRFKDTRTPDGVVINIMFKDMNYNEKFDVVIGTFMKNRFNYKDSKSRFPYMPEKQICLKNLSLFKPENEYKYQEKIDELEVTLDELNFKSEKKHLDNYVKTSYNKSRNHLIKT